jgi:ubiquitin fusion degradation protein 1
MFNFPFDGTALVAGGGSFVKSYHCYSVSCAPNENREELEVGGKIIMPPSALDALTRQHIEYPMLFKLTNKHHNRSTHCGVLEFVANEGHIYIPFWMMCNLQVEEGGLIEVRYTKLPVATFARFQPLSTEFLELSNPKAVLENILRSFACLTLGDELAIKHLNKVYGLRVLETKPAEAVTIIECDMSVDFAPPLGYEEEMKSQAKPETESDEEVNELMTGAVSTDFQPFVGSGQRLDGKTTSKRQSNEMPIGKEKSKSGNSELPKGIPDYDYKPGFLYFIRRSTKTPGSGEENDKKAFVPFEGQGNTLRPKKKDR